jgi:hypothetical protein
MHIQNLKLGLAGLVIAVMTACSSVAPKYTPDPEHINRLRDAGLAPTKVGEFTAEPKNGADVNHLTIRGGTYASPYEGSYVNYLKEALRQELDEARLLDPNAGLEVTGVLIQNDLNAGISTAYAQIEARFVVKRNGQTRFDKVKSVRYEWESAFAAATAYPLASENYVVTVKRLLGDLYSDLDFLAALKK